MGIIPFVTAPIIDVFLFSGLMALILSLSQKFLVNQDEARRLKDRMASLNKEMKAKQNDKEAYSRIMDDYMKENSVLMRMSMKPSLLAFVLFIFIFIPTLEHSYGDRHAILTEGIGNVTLGAVSYAVSYADGKASVDGAECTVPCEKEVNGIGWEMRHEPPSTALFVIHTPERMVFSRVIARLPIALPLAGENVSWTGWYLISLIPFVMLFRKIMKISL
ncbi:MAG: DUF106 domain-containing protein [Candidatus Aenigmarchaeota archaeon]|nr:DUF106 domain-containing protein [Candidatus Aenigmarchaeota archaeon]